jgi:uncharacterized protein YjeT (DUF2065 family)
MGRIIAGFVLLIVGVFPAVWTKEAVRFQIWIQHALMGAQYIPSQRTFRMMRIVGVPLVIVGLILLIWSI